MKTELRNGITFPDRHRPRRLHGYYYHRYPGSSQWGIVSVDRTGQIFDHDMTPLGSELPGDWRPTVAPIVRRLLAWSVVTTVVGVGSWVALIAVTWWGSRS